MHVLPGPDEGRVGARQLHLHGVVVDDLEVLDRVEAAAGAHRYLGIDDRLVGELDVVRRKGLPVAPLDVALQIDLPDEAVGRDAAIGARRHLGREVRDEIAVLVDVPERIEHAGFGHVLGAGVDVEERVELHRLLRHRHDDAVPPVPVAASSAPFAAPARTSRRETTLRLNFGICSSHGCVVMALAVASQGSILSLGSSASRSPSPKKLKLITVIVIITPGKIASQGSLSKYP